MAYPFFTIGHSTRTVSQFVDLLQASQIEFVVDVRHIPRSRTNPQFNRETLAEELATGSCSFLLSAGAAFLDIHNQCCRLQGGMRSNKRRSAADVIKLSDLRDRQFFPRRHEEST